jgi:hypothetical protein
MSNYKIVMSDRIGVAGGTGVGLKLKHKKWLKKCLIKKVC